MNNISIGIPDKKEIDIVVDLYKKCVIESNSKFYTQNILENWLKNVKPESFIFQYDTSNWIVIKEEEEIAGYAQYNITEEELYRIQVAPNHRNKGFGTQLYKFIEQDFLKNAKSKISLLATLDVEEFYTKMGFKTLEKVTHQGIEMIRMQKDLNAW